MFLQIVVERFFVGVGNGDVLFPEHDAVALDDVDFRHLNDERAVHADKLVGRQPLFDCFHIHERKDAVGRIFRIDFHIVLQSFDVGNFRYVNLNQLVP